MLGLAPIQDFTVNTKILLFAALVLGLASCNNNEDREPTANGTTQAAAEQPAAATTPGAATPLDVSKVRYVVFETTQECAMAGWNPLQCDRAHGTAQAMAKADSPLYATAEQCQAAWKNCGAAGDGKFTPGMVAFAIAGEDKGDAPPSAENPAFYIPAFSTKDGKLVHVTGTREKPILTQIDPDKVLKAVTVPPVAPALQAEGEAQAQPEEG